MQLKFFQTVQELQEFFEKDLYYLDTVFKEILDIIKCRNKKHCKKFDDCAEAFREIWNSLLRDNLYLNCGIMNCSLLYTLISKFMQDIKEIDN
jgi:hypothetical protein